MPAASAPGVGLARRVLSAAVLVAVLLGAVVWAPWWGFPLLVVVASAVAAWELGRLAEPDARGERRVLSVALGAGAAGSFLWPSGPALVGAGAALVVFGLPAVRGEVAGLRDAALPLTAMAYVGWFAGHAILLHARPDGARLVLALVGITAIGETSALLVGRALGRRPLAPAVSPKKTVEGALAQLAASVGAAWAFGAWLLPGWGTGRAVFAGAVLGVVGQVGDLAESSIKRAYAAKDAGATIPGHGGVLDRIDGLLFNAPALYYFVRWAGEAR